MPPTNLLELDSVHEDHQDFDCEDKRNQTKQARLAADRKKRFMRVAQTGVPIGVTNMDAKDGPGQLVFYVADRHDNVYARRAKGQSCSGKHIVFKSQFDRNQERRRAVAKRNGAVALKTLELREQITTAEAVMADRHMEAFQSALKLAATRNNFPGASPYAEDYTDDPVALEIFNRRNNSYQQDICKELMAHACTFYFIHQRQFPKRFDAAIHLDYFIIWYKSQVYIQRHNTKPQLDNTIRQMSYQQILNAIDKTLDNVEEIAQYSHRILTPANYEKLLRLSPITDADTRPDALVEHFVEDIMKQLRGLAFGYNVEKEVREIFKL
ncbi:hypothetical protein KCU65_g4825, partial [Aureobasidium melanogenum]